MPRIPFNSEVISRHNWLQTLSLETLKKLAESRGISNFAKMDHKQLIDVLTQMGINANPLSTPKTDSRVQ